MLIERLELAGIPVVSANTDGIVIKCPRAKLAECEDIVTAWELFDTGYSTEATEYSAMYSRDVNNYIAIKPDGTTKTKGVFATEGLMKNPVATICTEAVIEKLVNGTPVGETIQASLDVRKFVVIRTVKGGAVWRDQELGKAVRWVHSPEGEPIYYKTNGNKVATSEGAWPLMDLPDVFPDSLIDYEWYENKANEMLEEIGYV